MCAYGPVEVLIPIGIRRAANIGNGTCIGDANHGLGEASVGANGRARRIVCCGVVEVACQTAVANAEEILASVGQCGNLGSRQFGLVPFLFVAMGGIVQETNAIVDAVINTVVGATITG